MLAIEVERERIEELQLPVILEEVVLFDPGGGARISGELGLEARLTLDLAFEHALGKMALGRRDGVDQHLVGSAVAPVVEAPAVHARDQRRVGMVLFVEVRGRAARARDVDRRRVDQVVGQAGARIDLRRGVELGPALVMLRDHVKHHLARLDRLELGIAEGTRKLAGERGVFVHGDGEARGARGRGLDDHRRSLLGALSIEVFAARVD